MNETQFDSKTETRPIGISGRLSGGPAAHCRHSSGSKSNRCTLVMFPPLLLELPPRGRSGFNESATLPSPAPAARYEGIPQDHPGLRRAHGERGRIRAPASGRDDAPLSAFTKTKSKI
jgi:hypothetical protein